MKVLVCGGRWFHNLSDKRLMDKTLSQLHNGEITDYSNESRIDYIDLIIEGGAEGADRFANEWAYKNGVPTITMKPNWDFYGIVAGPIRNGWMLKFCEPHLVVAFPGGTGTANMVKQAKNAGIEVQEISE